MGPDSALRSRMRTYVAISIVMAILFSSHTTTQASVARWLLVKRQIDFLTFFFFDRPRRNGCPPKADAYQKCICGRCLAQE